MDLELHPKFNENKLIYMSYATDLEMRVVVIQLFPEEN